jgi:Fur family ferric uptake transcriptional regulator
MGPRPPATDAPLRLKDAGLRVTASRVAVLELLSRAPEPLSHPDVVDAIGEATWNRSTLYRNLIDLTDAGLLRRSLINGVTRFEPGDRANACADHAHFVCTACGGVSHLDGVTIRIEGEPGPRALFTGPLEVQLRGRCDACDAPG